MTNMVDAKDVVTLLSTSTSLKLVDGSVAFKFQKKKKVLLLLKVLNFVM